MQLILNNDMQLRENLLELLYHRVIQPSEKAYKRG
jgi:hypothetical protein